MMCIFDLLKSKAEVSDTTKILNAFRYNAFHYKFKLFSAILFSLYFPTVFDTLVGHNVVYKTDAVESLLSLFVFLSVSKH